MKALLLSFMILTTLFHNPVKASEGRSWNKNRRPLRMACDGESLINSNGRLLKKFTFGSECEAALATERGGLVCGDDMGQVMMISARYGVVKKFTFKSECVNALNNQQNGFSCTSDMGKVELWNLAVGRKVYAFTFSSDCQNSLSQVSEGPFFCARNVGSYDLVRDDGKIITKGITFESECQKTRDRLNGNDLFESL